MPFMKYNMFYMAYANNLEVIPCQDRAKEDASAQYLDVNVLVPRRDTRKAQRRSS